ncbi:hypothetical protein BsWGS_04037 [Bradybaena similaris]
MTMSKADEDDGRDKYEPIRRLSMVQLQPPRNPGKPFTSFCIKDILGIASMQSERNIQKSNNSNSYNEYTDHRLLQQKQNTRGQSDEVREFVKTHSVSSRNDNQKRNIGGKDTEMQTSNTRRKDKQRQGLKPALAPLNRSSLSNGGPRPTVSGLTSSFQFLAHGDLLQLSAHSSAVNLTRKIVRPWNNDRQVQSPPAASRSCVPTPGAILTASEASSDEDEEISVDDDEPPARSVASNPNIKSKAVSPLDALMAMTSKTFEGLEGGSPAGECRAQLMLCRHVSR